MAAGTYTIEARGAAPSNPGPGRWTHWARQEVVVTTADLQDVDLIWMPTVGVESTVAFKESGAREPPSSTTVRLLFSGQLFLADVPKGVVNPAGVMVIGGVAPGDYWFRADLPDGWRLQSLSSEQGEDLTYLPLPVRTEGAPLRVRATYVVGSARLEGRLLTPSGQPSHDRAIVIFPDASAAVDAPWPNVHVTRPDTKGRFELTDLIEGTYLLAVFEDHGEEAWTQAAFLRGLAAGASKVTMPVSGTVTQDLRLGARNAPR